jgi:hypothetical protein
LHQSNEHGQSILQGIEFLSSYPAAVQHFLTVDPEQNPNLQQINIILSCKVSPYSFGYQFNEMEWVARKGDPCQEREI